MAYKKIKKNILLKTAPIHDNIIEYGHGETRMLNSLSKTGKSKPLGIISKERSCPAVSIFERT